MLTQKENACPTEWGSYEGLQQFPNCRIKWITQE